MIGERRAEVMASNLTNWFADMGAQGLPRM